MTFQIIQGFDESATLVSDYEQSLDNSFLYGFEYEALGTLNSTNADVLRFWQSTTAFNSLGNSAYFNSKYISTSPSTGMAMVRPVTHNAKLTMGFAVRLDSGENPSGSSYYNGYRYGFRSVAGDTIHFAPVRPGAAGTPWYAGLYINGTLRVTGTTNLSTGTPWTYIEIHLDTGAGTAALKCSELAEGSYALPGGWTAARIELCHLAVAGTSQTSGLVVLIDDLVVYDTDAPHGICKVYSYAKTSDDNSGFTDGSDGGATTAAVNTFGWTNGYRASATVGQEDLFSYSNVLPTGIQATTIFAVKQTALVAAGSYNPAGLYLNLQQGGSDHLTDVSASCRPFSLSRVDGAIYETDPATSAAWTRAGAQAVKTGYRVKAV